MFSINDFSAAAGLANGPSSRLAQRLRGRGRALGNQAMRIAAALLAAALVSAACAPVITQRGYLADPDLVSSIDVGKDTKTSVQKRLGDPSTEATFSADGWYYISSTEKQVAFFTPTILKRNILAVYFDK